MAFLCADVAAAAAATKDDDAVNAAVCKGESPGNCTPPVAAAEPGDGARRLGCIEAEDEEEGVRAKPRCLDAMSLLDIAERRENTKLDAGDDALRRIARPTESADAARLKECSAAGDKAA